MADGDQTWIGERGGNLSGGQKQRIALARAAYSRAEMYVLDSPLSAVDMYTCQHIFKYCIEDMMIGGGGIVVLATHQTELFSMSDHLIVMQDSDIVYNNKYSYEGIKHLFPSFHGDEESLHITPSAKKPQRTADVQKSLPGKGSPRKLISKEATGPEKVYRESIYVWYIKRMGIVATVLGTLVFICGQIMRVYSDNWISVWSKRKYKEAGYNDDAFYAGIYSGLVFFFLFLAFLRAFVWYYVGKGGANNIHDLTFGAALKAPMHFFHVTPIGKLLSFFSKDIDVIDDVLVDNVLMLQILAWILILALGVVTYNLLIYLAVCGGLGVIYVYTVRIFVRTSEPIKFVSGTAQSAVIAHTAETLSGLAVVRAFRQQDRFITDNVVFQTRSTVLSYSLANLSLWLAYRVDIIGALLVLICALLAVLSDDLDSSVAGLIVSNSFQILLFFSIMSRFFGEVQDNMGAVERARVMSDLEEEHQPKEVVDPSPQWPGKGGITFEGVVMPYLPGKPPVLKGVTFDIHDGEKIGVVGRTGAGKSSLIVALYRLAEISAGEVHVDFIDCSKVNLNKLRRSMAIIPQEPVMFSGTIRTNLDPFYERSEEELMDVLYKCLLGPMLEHSEDGLDTKVEPMGANFSLGTQQLMCLARAMLNPSRILLLDEATAALDSDTNNAVQEVLRTHFSDRTIFTIAHRLDTVIDSDRILTMSDGVVFEFERPDVLLETEGSIFHDLCMNAGKAQFEVLKAKAKAHAKDKVYKHEAIHMFEEIFA
jgi:ATP-binding cassette, subfamily C (CFTR/MRP), member 1